MRLHEIGGKKSFLKSPNPTRISTQRKLGLANEKPRLGQATSATFVVWQLPFTVLKFVSFYIYEALINVSHFELCFLTMYVM